MGGNNLKIRQKYLRTINRISFWISLFSVLVLVFDVGFRHDPVTEDYLENFYMLALLMGTLSIGIRYYYSSERFAWKVRIFDGIIISLYLLVTAVLSDRLLRKLEFLEFFNNMGWVYLAVVVYFMREFSTLRINYDRQLLNPAQLFILSFLSMIMLATFLLMLPKATHSGISLLDALFTATSAVCVTGLIVVDTGSYFTQFGQVIILVFIQLGGLGIMTFASYFSYFFRGKTSFENQIMLKDMTNSEKISEVFGVLKKIIGITFLLEFIGAIGIFMTITSAEMKRIGSEIFFSIFHSISAFCNAGFSTLTNGLYEAEFQFNYPLQLIITFLFILGGIGFPILFNLYRYFLYRTRNQFMKISKPYKYEYVPWVININTRIVLLTTLILLSGGTLLFFWFEYDSTLAGHSLFGKVVTSFFGAATPRTAGFNSVDMGELTFPTVMITMLLMWIGASPGSTGGGIKTSTFAVATLNFLSLARGKDRVEVFRRQISNLSVRRAFAIISLSLLVIGIAICFIAVFDGQLTLFNIAFECFSAYSTVGLSLGITDDLSGPSKFVIIAVMFIGRVSMLTILIAFLRRVKHQNYRFPKEEILMT